MVLTLIFYYPNTLYYNAEYKLEIFQNIFIQIEINMIPSSIISVY